MTTERGIAQGDTETIARRPVDDVSNDGDVGAMDDLYAGGFTTHFLGADADIQATDRRFEVPVVTIIRVEDGRIAEEWRLANALGTASQLGLLPDSPGAVLRLVGRGIKRKLAG